MFNNNSKNLYTALLHRIGCTHRDLKTMILERQFSPENIYDELQNASQKMLVLLGEKKFEKSCKISKKLIQKNFSNILTRKIFASKHFSTKIFLKRSDTFIKFLLLFILYEVSILRLLAWESCEVEKNTEYGKNVLRKIFSEIPYQNVSIISGGAYGIDSLAHELALQHHLHTIAVFGCGIDIVYPKTNAKLFEKILEL